MPRNLYSPRLSDDVVRALYREPRVPSARYYTPQLERDLITLLFHAAKARRIPMTRLASALVREGLARLGESAAGETRSVREGEHPSTQAARR